ncbi:YHYH protein [Membranihabitans marinus]|uniref:YHYH protein n=1 Tax=Membranihabitans marinus TaxID=1227546 RepID=UPI001F35CE68|nr:YHYH protein [Membranihabitans marinus]
MRLVIFSFLLFQCFACHPPDSGRIVSTGSVDITTVVQASYNSNISISTTDTSIRIKSDGLPDHNTPYWGEGHDMYEDFPNGHHANVNTSMTAKNYTMTIPTHPAGSDDHEETSLGPIGLALNGVPIYNDREGGNRALDALTLTTFDNAGAHPGPGEDYHYHVTGRYTTMDDANLVGFLRDGFPIYGRQDVDGSYPNYIYN